MNRVESKPEFRVSLVVVDHERYVLLYDAADRRAAMQALGKWAADPELSFTWTHAAAMESCINKTLGDYGE